MNKRILVANWKQSGTRVNAIAWTDTFDRERGVFTVDTQIVVCPPLKALDLIKQEVKNRKLPIAVGVQDIDLHTFEGEKNTGSVSPALLADSASYAIIGHSETRRNLQLTDGDVAKKVTIAKKHNLIPIVCISEIEQVAALKKLLGEFYGIIAYEPLFAIGTGNPDTPEGANDVASAVKEMFPEVAVLYGGSVDGSNVKEFLNQVQISGVLVGNRSVDPAFFLEIVKNAH